MAGFLNAALVAAMAWLPADGWRETPDPSASQRARKGGVVRFAGGQSPKSYNAYVDGSSYSRMTFDLMYDSLLSVDRETLDFRPGLARRWATSDDGREFAFELDPEARWSDGSPVTAADVKWTFDAVTAPESDTGSWKAVLGAFDSPEDDGGRVVRFRRRSASGRDWRDLMHCGLFPVLPRHAFEGRDFNRVSFVGAPVSGPYRLSRVVEAVEGEWTRVSGWWRAGRPSAQGLYNFDRIVLRYYADNENAFEALKKRLLDVYPVYSARIMNDETKGRQFARNWILRRRVRNRSPIGFQGFAMNMRRPPFDDLRVRQAMARLVDRETMNRTLMNGEYFLHRSYFEDLYDESRPCRNPTWTFDVEGARRLLAEAGLKDGFSFTFLSRSAGEDKFLSPFSQALAACGVKMEIVRKDFAGWMRDMDSFTFDMTWAAWGAGAFRNPETSWSSAEGRRQGGGNVTGLAMPEVDALVEAEKRMDSAAEREDAYRRIDRLVAGQVPYVLLWNTDQHRILYWNKFGTPRRLLGLRGDEEAVLTYWWQDDDRVRELDEAVANETCLPSVPVVCE